MLRGANCKSGPCSNAKYSSEPTGAATPPCFTSATTPTTVNQGMVFAGPDGRTRLPTGLCPGQKRFAIIWFTNTTGVLELASDGSKPRPSAIRMPMASR